MDTYQVGLMHHAQICVRHHPLGSREAIAGDFSYILEKQGQLS